MCSTTPEPHHNEAGHDPIDDMEEVELEDEIAALKQEIGEFKAKVTGIEKILAPLQEDVKATGQGTLEAMAGLEVGITKNDTTLCRTIDMVQEVRAQLGGTRDKVTHLEDAMGELDLNEVAEDICQLLATTKNTEKALNMVQSIVAGLDCKVTDDFAHIMEDMNALSAQMAGFDLVEVVANIDNRFHDVCQRVHQVEIQFDELTGLKNKVADQDAKISAQNEKINALEQKLDRFANYLDNKVEAMGEKVSSIPKIRSRLNDLDDYTNTHSIGIKRLRDDHDQAYSKMHQKLDHVNSLYAHLNEDVEQCARKTKATDDEVHQQRGELAKLEEKMADMTKGCEQTSCAIQKTNTTADTNFNNFSEQISNFNDKVRTLAENQEDISSATELLVMNAVHRKISSLDEKLGQFAEGYDCSVKDCDTRFDQVFERLSEQEGFEDSAMKKIRKLEKQSEIVPYLQAKLTKLDASTTTALRTLDAEGRQESTRVNAKLTLFQNESKTLFKSVDNLDVAIGIAKKKLAEVDQDGPAVVPKSVAQVWKDFGSIKMRRYHGFEEFKSIFVFYAKAAGVPEHAWKAEMHSRLSTRVQNATTWLLERDGSFDDFCRQLSVSVQRVRHD